MFLLGAGFGVFITSAVFLACWFLLDMGLFPWLRARRRPRDLPPASARAIRHDRKERRLDFDNWGS